MSVYVHVHVCGCMPVHGTVCAGVQVCVHMYECECIYTHVCACVCIYNFIVGTFRYILAHSSWKKEILI